MKTFDVSRLPPMITLGYDGENNWRPNAFDCSSLLKNHPNGTISLWLLPNGETQAFPVALTRDGNSVVWTPLSEEMTAATGALQIVCTDGTDVGKSSVVMFRVDESIIPGADHPAAVPSWATQTIERAESAADRAEEAAESIDIEHLEQTISATVEAYLEEHPIDVDLPFAMPEDYGAKGDGETDDTAAIQAALDASSSVMFGQSKIYLISDSLQLNSGHIVDLNGSTIQQTVDKPIFVKHADKTAISKLHIRNGYLVGTVTATENTDYENQCGIYLPSYHSTFEQLRFDNLCYGIYIKKRDTGTATLVENRILDIKFANCAQAAIYAENGSKTENGVICNCKIGGTGDHGIYLFHSAGWQMSNVHVYAACDTAMEIRGAGGTQIVNLDIDRYFTRAGLIIADYSSCVVTNAKIAALTPGSFCLWSQTTGSQTWTNKPLMLSNIEFSTNAASGAGIVPIHGYGNAYGVQLIYNDENGGFAPNDFEPQMYGIDRFPAISGGKEITGTKDFNDYVEPGNWFISAGTAINNAVNIPARVSGRLIVSNTTGSTGTYLYRRQEFVPYTTVNAISYYRFGTSSDNGTTWNWRPWVAVRDVLSSGEAISSGDDCNNYVTPGAWLIRTTAIATNTANIPVETPGRLFVMDTLNSYVRGESSIYIRQFYVPYSTAHGIYSRYAVYSNGAWTFHDWVALATEAWVEAQGYLTQHQSLAGYATESYVQTQIAAIPDELPAVTATDNGKSLVVENGAWGTGYQVTRIPRVAMTASDTTPTLNPNTFYVFPEMATLTPTLATPTDNTIVNEYHFVFDSGATATVLTLPASILQPDGFTVEANTHYEISILEGAMTAQGWAVSA